MKLNKKGFTLVEILATIVILGILIGIAVVSISYILSNAKDGFYKNLEEQLILATKSYYTDHRTLLPQNIGQKRKVTVETLIKNNYFKRGDVVDYSKEECDTTASYVQVIKSAKDNFIYTVYLKCPAYSINHEDEIDSNLKVKVTLNKASYIEDSSAQIDITVNSLSAIASYQYTIYKSDQVIYTSDSILGSGNPGEAINKTIKLKKYVPGVIKVVATAYDIYGNVKSDFQSLDFYDEGLPRCGDQTPSLDLKDNSDWINSSSKEVDRKITMKCVNSSTKCLSSSFSKTFTEDADESYISILGENGEEVNCPVTVMIDKTKPVCGDKNDSTTWTNSNRTVSVECRDVTSGCKESSYSETFDDSNTKNQAIKTKDITIMDNAGNTESCVTDVYVDKENPTCTISKSTSSNATSITLTVSGSDLGSGVNSYSWTSDSSGFSSNTSKTITSNGTYTAFVKDNVGNIGSCSIDVANIYSVYKINYNYNGGSGNDCPSEYVSGQTTTLCTPIRENYSFDGWYTDSEFKNRIMGISSTQYGDITLYAKWTDLAPICGEVTGNTGSTWVSSRTVTVGCKNSDGTTCDSVQGTYTSNGNHSLIITGSNGITRSCSFTVSNIDAETPSISFSDSSNRVQCNGRFVSEYAFKIINTPSGFRSTGSKMVVKTMAITRSTYNYGSSSASIGNDIGCPSWSTVRFGFASAMKPSITATACNNAGRCASAST